MAPSKVLKSVVPQSLHSEYDKIAKKGGDVAVVDGSEVQEFGKVLQHALSKGKIDEYTVRNMGYSCKQIMPCQYTHRPDDTWSDVYAHKGDEIAEKVNMIGLKYTNPLLHHFAQKYWDFGDAVNFIPRVIGGMSGMTVGMLKDIKEGICGPSYVVE